MQHEHAHASVGCGQDFLSRHQMHLLASLNAILYGCSHHIRCREHASRCERCSFALKKVPCDMEKLVLVEGDRTASLSPCHQCLAIAALLLSVSPMLWLCQDSMRYKACGR